MNIADLYGSKIKTKFSGAGVIPYCKHTDRYLLVRRADGVKLTGTWAGLGGEIDEGETPREAASREAFEEAGFNGKMILTHVYKYDEPKFEYYNFIGIVAEEFTPDLNWENDDYVWAELGSWPKPLHPGIEKMLANWTWAEK